MMNFKTFRDCVHGHMTFHPLFVAIIDTPEFQRLRNIKQTSSLYMVYPSSSHNRFEHSLGTAFLANELVSNLRKNQPELGITDADILCVGIAGLCHDLGHGPFSYSWEKFLKFVDENSSWKHEEASVRMLDHLIHKNNLKQKFLDYGLCDDDITFIKDLILGERKITSLNPNQRGSDKDFLFEIVSNKRSGVDVDRWEYFLRDCHNLGLKCNFDYQRFILYARVINIDGEGPQICIRDKEAENLYNMFYTRWNLFRCAYSHKTAMIIEEMLCEALLHADQHLLFSGESDRKLTLSEASFVFDMTAYAKLTDHVFYQIISSSDPCLAQSQAIINRIQHRQLYTFTGQAMLPSYFNFSASKLKSEIYDILKNENNNAVDMFEFEEKVIVKITSWDYGMSNENPIDRIKFYSKLNPNKAKPIRKSDISYLLPQEFMERAIRVLCKETDQTICQVIKKCFWLWCSQRNLNPL